MSKHEKVRNSLAANLMAANVEIGRLKLIATGWQDKFLRQDEKYVREINDLSAKLFAANLKLSEIKQELEESRNGLMTSQLAKEIAENVYHQELRSRTEKIFSRIEKSRLVSMNSEGTKDFHEGMISLHRNDFEKIKQEFLSGQLGKQQSTLRQQACCDTRYKKDRKCDNCGVDMPPLDGDFCSKNCVQAYFKKNGRKVK